MSEHNSVQWILSVAGRLVESTVEQLVDLLRADRAGFCDVVRFRLAPGAYAGVVLEACGVLASLSSVGMQV